MSRKEQLYAVIGGCVGAVVTLMMCSFFPQGVQTRVDKFDVLTCTELNVVGADSKPLVILAAGEHGGAVGVTDEYGNVAPLRKR